MTSLFKAYKLSDDLTLSNRVVMSPLTRTRTSAGDTPNPLMANYYGQRATAGLIITEATDVSPHSKGYVWTPGVYTQAQIDGWRLVTEEVHHRGGVIFLQIWHVGRMAHTSLMPGGQAPWGVTSEKASHSDVFARDDATGEMTFVRASAPRQIGTEEIADVVGEFTVAFQNARHAGFDGVEIHGANGYLLDQFMNSTLNTRADAYGGQTPESSTRALVEIADAAVRAFGAGRVGVRLSPFGEFNGMPADPRAETTLIHLCGELNRRGVGYVHLVYELMPSGNLTAAEFKPRYLNDALLRDVRKAFRGALIWAGGFDGASAQAALDTGLVDLIAFGRPFIANPDLVERLKNGWPLAVADPSTYYTRRGALGYTDFPRYREE
jgi:N-ethylmaleimide reductase